MRKIYLFSVIAACTFALSSCKGFLDIDENTKDDEQETYNDYSSLKAALSGVYSNLTVDFGQIGSATKDAASDDAIYTWESSSVYDMYNNLWSSMNTLDNKWSTYYEGIYQANYYLETISVDMLDMYEWTTGYDTYVFQLKIHLLEARVLRAFFHYELAIRYGNIPIVTEVLAQEDANDQEQSSWSEVIDFIVSECDEILASEDPYLLESYATSAGGGAWGDTGRVTRGFVMALKARALLYDASPLHNTSGDTSKWADAAEAAWAVMQTGTYSLQNIDSDPLFINEGDDILSSTQLIMERRQTAANSFEKGNLPYNFDAACTGGNTPTENLAEVFEMKDGTTFDLAEHAEEIYVDADGNQSRDPRFYRAIMHDGFSYKSTEIKTYYGGTHALPIVGATLSGYYQKRYIFTGVSVTSSAEVTLKHHYILFRYAEVLLNYAEAINELVGADATYGSMTMTARQAIDVVRAAANMPGVDTSITGDDFTQYIKDERRRELALEGHRFWDIRRWKMGDVVKNIYGMSITLNTDGSKSYEKTLIQTRQWDDKMYYYPIPMTELLLNDNLEQNPGW